MYVHVVMMCLTLVYPSANPSAKFRCVLVFLAGCNTSMDIIERWRK